jgi:hypothetical protein
VSGAIIRLKQTFLTRYIAHQNAESKPPKKRLLCDMQLQEEQGRTESLEPAKTVGPSYLSTTMILFVKAA